MLRYRYILLLACQAMPALALDKQVMGWAERVRVEPAGIIFHAKLDTGARTSSINAHNIEEFERDGETWVRFEVINRRREAVQLEMPKVREVKIMEHSGDPQRRPVVLMGICLGKIYKEVEVNLVDRSEFIYGMLLGRTFLKGDVIVDPSRQYTTKPDCKRNGDS